MLCKNRKSSRQNPKRSVLFVLAIAFQLTALALLATPSEAFAQLPGEWSNYTSEHVGGGNLFLDFTYSEARNGGHLLSVWRSCVCGGNTNIPVVMSLDNGRPFQIGVTASNVSPTVVPWGPNAFMVFHTGTDGNIWFTPVYGDGSNSGTWYNVPGNTTQMPVSVAQMGTDSYNLYMVYRGFGNDPRVWGTWFGGPNGWSTPENISGGLANTAPAVVMNNVTNNLFVTVQGTDNQLWMTNQPLGAIGWNSWTPLGIDTFDTPHAAATADGNMVVSILNAPGSSGNAQPEYAKFDRWGNRQSGWSTDTSGQKTFWAVQLAANGNFVYSLITKMDGLAQYAGAWKQVYDGQ
jgi:hypothetical protein